MKGCYCKADSFNFIRTLLMAILAIALTACGGGSPNGENAESRSSDRTPPSIQLIGSNIVNLSYNETYEELGATAIDNEDGTVPVTISGNVDTTTLGNQLIEYIAKDSAGNESKAIRVVVVYDQIPPSIQLNGELEIITALNAPYQDQGATAIDEFDGIINPTVATDVNVAREGMYFVSYFASDTSGNTSTITRIVFVRDLTPPSIQLNGPSTVEINEDTTYTELGAITSDNLDTSVHLDINNMVDTSTPGNYTVTYTATDNNGNQSTATRTVIVLDTTPPVISLKGSSQIKINQRTLYFESGASATDNSGLPVSVSISGRVDSSIAGTYLITYTSTDAAGNTATKTRTVEVLDITPPVITLIGDDEITIDEGSVYSEQGATVTDNVDADPEIAIESNLDINTPGTYQITYTATDNLGNSSTLIRTVIVRDITAPVIVLNGDSPMYINVDSQYWDPRANAEDNVDGSIVVRFSHNIDTSIQGSYLVTYEATDSSGNTSTLTRTVIVKDLLPPVIQLNGEETVTLKVGENYVELGATATDNVDSSPTIEIESNININHHGSYSVSYYATDTAGNQSTIIRNVKVIGEFITTWKTDNSGISEDNQIQIPIDASYKNQNLNIDWGDGSQSQNVNEKITHTYASPGVYTVKIEGDIAIKNGNSDAKKLLTIEQWGSGEWKSLAHAFYLCENLTINATDTPNLSKLTDISGMFSGASSLTGDLSQWDVTTVENMSAMFQDAVNFESDLSQWDVSSVRDTSSMFENATAFNSDLSSWNTGSLQYISSMFSHASSFNSNLNSWDVSKVTDMFSLFFYASNFNGDISQWDVSSVKDMTQMFARAAKFSGDLSLWNVSSVNSMSGMFAQAKSFNSDISSWDVSSVKSMLWMFAVATNFDRDLGSWDVSSVTHMDDMFFATSLSTENYDSLLNGWSARALNSNVLFDAGDSKYSSASQAARSSIISNYGWTITDGGLAPVP